MALASCHVGIVSHRAGRSAIAASAYRAAVKLQNDYDGLTHNYTRKKGVIYSCILAPENTPERLLDSNTLWNEHQKAQLKKNGELRDDAQLARDVTIALPQELTREQNIELAKDFAQVFVKHGMVVDLSVHDKGDGNPHAHYLLTMRDISEDGFSKKKNSNWDRNDYVIVWRKSYEDITNRYLDMNGFDAKICVDSYEKQGVDRIPTIHLGSAAHQMEQSGIETDRWNINRDIQKVNLEIEEINREIGLIKQEAEYVKSLEGASGYSVEKEPVEIFHHDMAAEHIREYNIQDAAIAPHYMVAEEEQVEIEEPLSDIPVEDLIEHYNRAFEDVKKTAETVGIILTEKGKQSLAIQQKNIENALERLKQRQEEILKGQLTRGGEYLADQQRSVDEAIQRLKPSTPEWETPDRSSPVGEPEPQRRSDFDEVYEVPDTQTRHPAPPHTAAGDSQEPHRASEEQTKMPQQHEYDARYETPEDWYIRKAKEQETPFHHAPTRKTDRQAEYDNLYRNPGGGSTNQRSHHPDPDDPDPKK